MSPLRKMLWRFPLRVGKGRSGTTSLGKRQRRSTAQPEATTEARRVPQWEGKPLITPPPGPVEFPSGAKVYGFPETEDERNERLSSD